jgi:protoporphyrinogen oxidase
MKKERKTISEKISRRDFLKTAAAGAAAAGVAGMAGKGLLGQMFPPGVQAAKKPPPPPPIEIDSAVIIGAGISGLTAAMLLADLGKTVTVIEQCHRPGGRIQTKVYPDGAHGQAAFMESYGTDFDPETHWMWNELGFGGQDIALWGANQYTYWRGQYTPQTGTWKQFVYDHPWDDEGGGPAFIESEDEFWYLEKDLVYPLDAPGSYYPDYDDKDFEDWMLWTEHKKKGKVPNWRSDVVEAWDLFLRSETGDYSYTSSAAWGIMSGIYWDLPTKYDILQDGMYAMIERLMTRIPAGSVKLNETVSSVTTKTDTTVEVVSNKGTYTADVAIVAVPHNKVKGIVPELTSAKIASLDSMGNTKNFVAMQQFSERFWNTVYGFSDDSWGGYSDQGINHTTRTDSISIGNETCFQTGTTGVLSHYLNDPTATNLWDPSDIHGVHVKGSLKNTITDLVLDDMENYFPRVREFLISGSERVYAWDPYGPNYPVGHVVNGNFALNRVQIPDPITPTGKGTIWFVGDYIHDFGVGDAILSALDVAARFGSTAGP